MKKSLSSGQLSVIAGSVLLVVLLYVLPHASAKKQKSAPTLDADAAIELVQSGQNPMAGITQLKKIVEKNPENVKALLFLGKFSIESRQYAKAIKWFNKVLQLEADNSDALVESAFAYERSGMPAKAVKTFNKVLEITDDTVLKNKIIKYIKEIKSN